MDTRNVAETQTDSEEGQTAQMMDTVKLVEMGNVSVETKGILHGLEIGFLPRSY